MRTADCADLGSKEFEIAVVDPLHPDAQILVGRLSAELAARYGEDGSGAFVPADVQGPEYLGKLGIDRSAEL